MTIFVFYFGYLIILIMKKMVKRINKAISNSDGLTIIGKSFSRLTEWLVIIFCLFGGIIIAYVSPTNRDVIMYMSAVSGLAFIILGLLFLYAKTIWAIRRRIKRVQ